MHIFRTGMYSAYCAHTQSRIVLIRSLRPKVHVIATSYLRPVLQNCDPVLQNGEDFMTKHNIDLVSTEYPRLQNSTWKIVKINSMHFTKLNDCLFDISFLAFEVVKINSDVSAVKI